MVKADPTAVKDSLLHELSLAKTPQDSIPLLYHLYDLAGRTDKRDYNKLLFNTAKHCNNNKIQLDIIRNTCNIYVASDSAMAICQVEAELLPQSDDQKETLTFIKVNRISRNVRASSEADKQKMLQKLIGEYKQTSNTDIYENILQLYTLCIYLGNSTQGELYTEYLGKLEKLIKQLPPEGRHVLPNMFYTQSAILYTQNEEHVKAIAADKELLKIIEQLTKDYRAQGRIFRNFDINYYNCYRRILGNYPALSRDEVESYYHKILELCKRNTTIDNNYKSSGRPLIYYLMASQRYSEAITYLKKYINVPDNTHSRMQLLKLLTEAATAVGDNATLLQTTTEYNKMLEEYNHLKAAEKYKELQILYDVNELKNQNAQLELEKREAEIESSRTVIHITFIAISVLLFLLIITCWLYYRTKRLAGSLQRSKQELQEEQHILLQTQKELTIARDQAEGANRMKTLFIQNMSHEIRTPLNAIVGFSHIMAECAGNSGKEDMANYSQIINANSELLLTLVGDVLDIAKMETGEIKMNLQPCSLQSVCNLAISNVEHRAKPGVKMYFHTDTPNDIMLLTDATRLEQVLINFLTNASKFTNEGEIVLSYSVDTSNQEVIFSVTDTGIGIPKDKAEIIFERFEKLDNFAQGTGLGLHICRLIANMLKGKVMVDTSYTDGARFLFIHPIVLKKLR
jgi:signal transduction histidine kinase